MQRLIVFNNVSLDGRFVDGRGDMNWAKEDDDPVFREFIGGNVRGEGALLFGRVTYEMMASFWPTAQARAALPAVAERMNSAAKFVFSKTLSRADWSGAKVVRGDAAGEVRRMKAESGPGLTILGSGALTASLAAAGLIDEYQFVVCPVALGAGRTMFDGLPRPMRLRLTQSRTFPGGKVLLVCEPR